MKTMSPQANILSSVFAMTDIGVFSAETQTVMYSESTWGQEDWVA